MLKIEEPLVSVDWLQENLKAPNLIVLDASINKITDTESNVSNEQIPLSKYFDLKNKFSDVLGDFPTTFPSEEQFTKEAQKLGVNKDSVIVIYDDKGIYSSPRAWWLFKAFGHDNVAVLDGGLLAWQEAGFKTVDTQEKNITRGNFIGSLKKETMCFFNDVVEISANKSKIIMDARSEGRFKCTVPEPRKGLRSGTIPNSKNLPFESILENGKMKSRNELQTVFNKFGSNDDDYVFTCGSGITACVLALGASLSGRKALTVYDGSWTEYGSLTKE